MLSSHHSPDPFRLAVVMYNAAIKERRNDIQSQIQEIKDRIAPEGQHKNPYKGFYLRIGEAVR